jgi:hypothetical protein
VTDEEDDGTDDERTLVDLKRKRGTSTTQEGASCPSGELLPSLPKKPRVTARKRKAVIPIDGDDNDEQPR